MRENNTFAHRLGAKSLHAALQREHEKQKSGGGGGGWLYVLRFPSQLELQISSYTISTNVHLGGRSRKNQHGNKKVCLPSNGETLAGKIKKCVA